MAVDEAVHFSLFGMGQMVQCLGADDGLKRRGGEVEAFDSVEAVADEESLCLLQPLFCQVEHGRGCIHAHHSDVRPKAKQPLFHLSGSDAQIQNCSMGTQPLPEQKEKQIQLSGAGRVSFEIRPVPMEGKFGIVPSSFKVLCSFHPALRKN
jgi:hypothetical protein